MSALVVHIVERGEDMDAIFRLRHDVFVKEQRVPEEIERDEDDDTALHVLATTEGRPLGTGRLVLKPDRRGKIGRMAVLEVARGTGVGRRLLETLLEQAKARGLVEVFLDAQVHALAFYEKLGFESEGPRFMEAGIEHQRMRRRLL